MKITKLGVLREHLGALQGSRSGALVSLLREAMSSGLVPLSVPDALVDRFSVSVPPDVLEWLDRLSDETGLSLSLVAAGLVQNLMRSRANAPSAVAECEGLPAVNARLGRIREWLHPLFKETDKALSAGRVAFVEAATGSGKGRMIAALAGQRIEQGHTPVVVSAPMNVVRQLVMDLRELVPTSTPKMILGRPNFVNPVHVREWVADHPDSRLRLWLEAGCPVVAKATKELQEALGVELAYLMEDAIEVAEGNVPVHTWALQGAGDEESEAEDLYLRLKSDVGEEAELILCSHTMLAADCRLHMLAGAGVLPLEFGTLIIDEAHQLEAAFASVYTGTIHLQALAGKIRKADLPVNQRVMLENAIGTLKGRIAQSWSAEEKTGTLEDDELRVLEESIRQFVKHAEKLPRTTDRTNPAVRYARKSLAGARAILQDALGGKATVQVGTTPALAYPTISVGRANLRGPLEYLWKRAHASALVSATLYLPDIYGVLTAHYSRWVLSVPKDRAHFMPPVHPEWVVKQARLHLVPTATAPDDSEAWLQEVESLVRSAAESAKGGTLVLCTSYATVNALAASLSDYGDCVIAQGGKLSPAACAARYRALYGQGKKPIWLGVGSAWTGVNLSDDSLPPERVGEDHMLSDLVIPRTPFRVNRSLTHHRRASQLFVAELNETARLLKQGMGRLVRKEGAPVKRIWFADPRVTSPNSKYSMIKKLLLPYQRVEVGAD
ncbi:helicase C-terminal domain-containing protein [Pseudomonas aeruginosa]|uniref:helicase C-terminal domain-containing protein n=1 Tax=Pseudomonas aeruginosa TaxID=287 RepID=UPI0012472199|nr:helicase C-terminal domain-containing protein [Pseudomonas aeruginosa]KAB0719963.1 hypothetical protein F7O90_31660 [Pseudomonas aeruginosa]MCW5524352.1 hypothetical protein [Pseudomonas aeruginosa]MCW5540483.1 hypothetical protein [Pseudomonas aeruginosa]